MRNLSDKPQKQKDLKRKKGNAIIGVEMQI